MHGNFKKKKKKNYFIIYTKLRNYRYDWLTVMNVEDSRYLN